MNENQPQRVSAIDAGPTANSHLLELRPLRRWVILAWSAWILSIGLLWSEHLMTVLHPPSLLFVFLVAVTFGSALIALVSGLWHLVRGPKRFGALAWLLVA